MHRSRSEATVAGFAPPPTAPLTRDPDTSLLWQDWDSLARLGAAGGAPLSGYGDGTFLGALEIRAIDGVRAVTPRAGLSKRYGGMHIPQFGGVDPQQGFAIELLWAEPTAFPAAPDSAGILTLGHVCPGSDYPNFVLTLGFRKGRVAAEIRHRLGLRAALQSALALGPAAEVAADTLAHVAVCVTGAGKVTVWVAGRAGEPVAAPGWESVGWVRGGHFGFCIGGRRAQDYRMGWKCAAVKVSGAPRGASAVQISARPAVHIDVNAVWRPAKTRFGTLHTVAGSDGLRLPEIEVYRSGKFTASTATVAGPPTDACPTPGRSGRYAFDWRRVDAYLERITAAGMKTFYLGLGGTPKLLGGHYPVPRNDRPRQPFEIAFSPAVPTDFDAWATLQGDLWWHLAVERGAPVEMIDFWNEPNLYSAGLKNGVFWRGTREQLCDLTGRAYRRIQSLFADARRARPSVVLPRFCWLSDAGWDPFQSPGRDNAAWLAAVTRYLAAHPDTPYDTISYHFYDGSLASFAGWAAFARNAFVAAGLKAPALISSETLPVDQSAGPKTLPWSRIPNFHQGAFAAAQLVEQLVFENEAQMLYHIHTGQYHLDGRGGLMEPAGQPRPDLNVATLYAMLGERLFRVRVDGSGAIRALAGRGEGGRAAAIVASAVWSPLPPALVEVRFGPALARRRFRIFAIDRAHSSGKEAGPAHAALESIGERVADREGTVVVELGSCAVIGLAEVGR